MKFYLLPGNSCDRGEYAERNCCNLQLCGKFCCDVIRRSCINLCFSTARAIIIVMR